VDVGWVALGWLKMLDWMRWVLGSRSGGTERSHRIGLARE
jgi:hypothetical protein